MHPEIKKFWIDIRYTIYPYYIIYPSYIHSTINYDLDAKIYWKIQRDSEIEQIIGITLGNGKSKYFIGGEWYWEEKALKVLKLKAFI